MGACVGMKGMRVQSIIRELRGEKIDIIEYHEDPVTFAEKALQPAKVSRVTIVDQRRSTWKWWWMTASFRLPSARRGRTFAWRRSCWAGRSTSRAKKRSARKWSSRWQSLTSQQATPLENVTDLGEALIEKLDEAGITTVEALADMTPEQLEASRASARRRWKKSVLR